MPLESSVAVNVTVTEDVYQLPVPLLPAALYVVTGGVMSLVLPGETVYVDGVDVGIVNVRAPTGVDCALRIRLVPPVFVRVTLHAVLGVKPEPSNTTAAALWSRNDTPAAGRLVTSRFATGPGHERRGFGEGALMAAPENTKPPTLRERLGELADQAQATLCAARE